MASITYTLMHNYLDRGFFWLTIFFLYVIVFVLPLTSVSIRRLHDVGFSGKWMILYFMSLSYLFYTYLVCENENWLFHGLLPQEMKPMKLFPFIVILFIQILFLVKSAKHYNKYGERPLY